jgi:hypothetical protein
MDFGAVECSAAAVDYPAVVAAAGVSLFQGPAAIVSVRMFILVRITQFSHFRAKFF